MLAGSIMCGHGRTHESYSYASQTKRDMMNALHIDHSQSPVISAKHWKENLQLESNRISIRMDCLVTNRRVSDRKETPLDRSTDYISCWKMPNVHVYRRLCLTLTSKRLSIACGWTAFSLNCWNTIFLAKCIR